jgi:hypothetical protein
MLAESLLTFEPAGPVEPQAARLMATPAADIAMAAERNFRMFISFPFILRAQRWVPVTCNAGAHFGFEAVPASIRFWVALAIFEIFRKLATGEVNLTVSRITVKGQMSVYCRAFGKNIDATALLHHYWTERNISKDGMDSWL